MNLTFCLQLDTDIPPNPYTQLDVAALLLLVVAGTWLAILSLLATTKGKTRRLEWVDLWPLLGMNLGAFMHILAAMVSNGLLVGIPTLDWLRNLHCSLWDFWLEFGLGFNLWFCSLIFIATKQCIAQLSYQPSLRDNAGVIAWAIISVFVSIILALCLLAEFGHGTVYVPRLDACFTSVPLKAMMVVYSIACLAYAIGLAILASLYSKNNAYRIRSVLYPLRTIAVLGVAILLAMLAINLSNVTVYSAGRLVAATLLIVLYLTTNTTFYRDVFLDLLHNKDTTTVNIEIELDEYGGELTREIERISFVNADAMCSDPRNFEIPALAFEQISLTELLEFVRRAQVPDMFTIDFRHDEDDDDDDEDHEDTPASSNRSANGSLVSTGLTTVPSEPASSVAAADGGQQQPSEVYAVQVEHRILVKCRSVGKLIKAINLLRDQDLSLPNALDALVAEHFTPIDRPTNHTVPLPAMFVATTLAIRNRAHNVVFLNCVSSVLVELATVYKPRFRS